MRQAVFFDLDDTLCDAKTAFAQGLQRACDTICTRHPYLTVAQVMEQWRVIHVDLLSDLTASRLSMAQVRLLRFRRLLAELGTPDDAFADAVDLLLGQTQLEHLRVFDGVMATLEMLRTHGVHVGIITNGAGDTHPDSQRSKAEYLGLLHYVDSFWVSDQMGHRKPDPRAFAPALRAAGCRPSEALFVGDSLENDVSGANRAGMVSVLLQRDGTVATPVSKVTNLPPENRPFHIVGTIPEVVPLAIQTNGAKPVTASSDVF